MIPNLERIYQDLREVEAYNREEEAELRGQKRVLLKLLRLKGFTLDAALTTRLLYCHDREQIDTWAGRVLDARSLADVFGPEV